MCEEHGVFTSPAELERLELQTRLLEEHEQPLYDAAFQGRREAAVLDVGCNDGSKALLRFSRPEVASVTGVDCHAALVERADRRARDVGDARFAFYQADVESGELDALLERVLAERSPAGFDVIALSMVLLHLRRPQELLRRLRRYLKPDGVLAILEVDDGYSVMEPDPDGLFQAFIALCALDPWGGCRTLGRALPELLAAAGYGDVRVLGRRVEACAAEQKKKQALFDVAFSYLRDDFDLLCRREPENAAYAEAAARIRRDGEAFRRAYVERASLVATSDVLVLCGRGA